MAFLRLEPWGADAENRRAGVIAATIASASPKTGSHNFKPSDFFPTPATAPAQEQSVDEQIAVLKAFNDVQRSNGHS